MKLYDISVPIVNGLTTWPGDRPPQIESASAIARGDPFNASRLAISSHAGTHVDAPYHFLPDGPTVERLPLGALIGPAIVLDLTAVAIAITAEQLDQVGLPAGVERLLLRTRNSQRWTDPGQPFDPNFVHLDPDGARWLVERGVRLVGIDFLSIEGYGVAECLVHRTLLGAGVVILEGLNLSEVAPGEYQLICLPLNIAGCDGAPARAVLIAE